METAGNLEKGISGGRMEKLNNREKDNKSGFIIFAATRVIIGITLAVAILWARQRSGALERLYL